MHFRKKKLKRFQNLRNRRPVQQGMPESTSPASTCIVRIMSSHARHWVLRCLSSPAAFSIFTKHSGLPVVWMRGLHSLFFIFEMEHTSTKILAVRSPHDCWVFRFFPLTFVLSLLICLSSYWILCSFPGVHFPFFAFDFCTPPPTGSPDMASWHRKSHR